jgi:preprotein translocase subunit SecD
MIQIRAWKVVIVAIATVFGILFTLPNLVPAGSLPGFLPQQRLNLGLDLQGGSHLLLEVDVAALRAERVTNLIEDVRRTLQQERIAFSGLGRAANGVSVTVTDQAQVQTAQAALDKLAQPLTGAATGRDLLVRRQGQVIQLTPVAESDNAEASKAVDQSIEIIRRRIDQLGTREPSIMKQGFNRIVVEAPGESDPERLRAVIGQTAKLTFQMVDTSVSADEAAAGRVPPSSVLLDQPDSPGEPQVLVLRRIVVAGEMLVDARPSFDQYGKPVVSFRFNGEGARRFGQATQQNVGKRFAIVLDNKVISAPVINEPITGGSGQISGNFTVQSSNDLALLLRSGALPAPLKVEEQRTVGAELGADAVRAGSISLAIGAVAIFAFIILAYGLFGVFAAIALVINVFMLIATLTLTQATLTLPGIAGLILTLAVAVDANVLIYERMRDEARENATPIWAVEHGFNRALVSIIDANVTTLISAAIMFQFGSGPVRGFAWTLSVGVMTSLFTALLIPQLLIAFWFRIKRPKKLPIS